MKRIIPLVLSVACLLALVGESRAFGRLFSRSRNVQKVVVKEQVQVQKVQVVKQVNVVEQVKVQRVVVQPVVAVKSYSYYPQAVQVQPVQAYYSVQAVQTYGYSGGCVQNSGRIQALERSIEQLQQRELQRLELERQRLQQPQVMPPAR